MAISKDINALAITDHDTADGLEMAEEYAKNKNILLVPGIEFDTNLIRMTLKEVYDALEERGYNANNQIVGYLISGDPGYISSYKNARTKIQEIDREKIVEILLKDFQKTNK